MLYSARLTTIFLSLPKFNNARFNIRIMKLSIIIPVYNEKATIEKLLSKLDQVDLGDISTEIVIVDDYSTDGSREILKKLEPKYNISYHEKNLGKGCALRTGFARAQGDILVVQDADLEYEPQDFKAMLEKMFETDAQVVYGSRRLQHSYLRSRHSGHIFALGGILLTWITNILYNSRITDEPTCYKMFKADILKGLDLKCERFEFCPEFTAKVLKGRIKIQEVPISYYPRHVSEGKKIRLKDFFTAVWTLIKYRIVK
jgi:dolichol-phosphate mannosyltransferase